MNQMNPEKIDLLYHPRKGSVEMFGFEITERQKAIIEVLQNDIDMPTKDVIKECHLAVSDRSVQRVRKWYKNYIEKNEDVFNTAEEKESTMQPWQEDLIRLVNEDGYWTISELCAEVGKDENQVRNALRMYKKLTFGNNILDEHSPTVFNNRDKFNNRNWGTGNWGTGTDKLLAIIPNTTPNRSDDFFEVEIDCVTSCSKVPQEVKVRVSAKVRDKVKLFMKWAGTCEWLGYLIGTKKEDGSVDVDDVFLPNQKASTTLVHNVDCQDYNKMSIIGVIHSHHEMGAGDEDNPSFSGHDANFINSNHNISLLAGKTSNGSFKVVGIARVKTPCGGFMKVKAKVVAMPEAESNEELELKGEFMAKVFGK